MKVAWSSENDELNVVKKKLLKQKPGFLQVTSYGGREFFLQDRELLSTANTQT